MGLIRALTTSVRSNLADQWKEYIQADSMGPDVLIQKGHARTTGNTNAGQSSNTRGSTDIITQGSVIAVNEGQAMLVVEDGKIIDFTCEPGQYTFDKSTEPSLFSGSFGQGLKATFSNIGRRFTFGGDTGKTQVVYYVNTKELIGNKFGSSQPMPYDDQYYGTVLYIRYFGTYSFKVVDPLKLYAALAGNVKESYKVSEMIEQSNNEFYTALDTAIGMLAVQGVKFSLLPAKQLELAKLMNDALDDSWRSLRGLEVVSVAMNKITPDDKSRQRIEEFDQANMYGKSNSAMQGRMVGAQAKMFENMGGQTGGASGSDIMGAMMGMMGMNMMQSQMANSQPRQGYQDQQRPDPMGTATVQQAPVAGTWRCQCGADNTGKFCLECGTPKPTPVGQWKCQCGAINTAKFCSECGTARPVETQAPRQACPGCGWNDTEGKNPKFCPECGKKLN